jgi:hypothetical protein
LLLGLGDKVCYLLLVAKVPNLDLVALGFVGVKNLCILDLVANVFFMDLVAKVSFLDLVEHGFGSGKHLCNLDLVANVCFLNLVDKDCYLHFVANVRNLDWPALGFVNSKNLFATCT